MTKKWFKEGKYLSLISNGALLVAMKTMEKSELLLLRYYYLSGLSMAEIAKLQRVDKATISRRLEKIRTQLFDQTRERLMQEINVRKR